MASIDKIKRYFLLLSTILIFAGLYIYYPELHKYTRKVFDDSLGFRVQKIEYIQTPRYCLDLSKIDPLRKYIGEPIFDVPADEEQLNIKSIDCYKSVNIRKNYPSTLVLHVEELEPIAIWQDKKNYYLVTESGETVNIYDSNNLEGFLVLTGHNAPKASIKLFEFLNISDKEILNSISSAIYIGSRRWNIRFKNGIEILLPEKQPDIAWKRFLDIAQKKNILHHKKPKYKKFDFRINDKLIVN